MVKQYPQGNTLNWQHPSNNPPDSVSAPATKPADKGKAPEHTVANKQLPITKEPIAQPPVHPFSGIPSCYAPPANRNFAVPNRSNDSAYRTMPPIYDIEQSKAVFEWILSTKVMVSVGKLCLVSQDIRNQFRTAITPKQLVGASTNTIQDPSNVFEDILLTFAIEELQFLLGSNTALAKELTLEMAPIASVNLIEAYIDLLTLGEEPMTLPIATSNTDTAPIYVNIPFPAQFVAKWKGVQVKKNYKPITMKTKPVTGHVSKDFQIEQHIIGNPLAKMPPLNPNLPPFIPTQQFTSEKQAKLVKDHNTGFLTSDKINVFVNMVTKQEKAFTWEDSE
ncbi:hypothetical protein C0989_003530 [Termitomyces sp. Mn162]|nr:hypothetical protein C0989_003530 [Termitomyces sp. Mn162]